MAAEELISELLTQELPPLIRNAIDSGDVADAISKRLDSEQRATLEEKAFSESEAFLRFTRREIDELSKARALLFEHERRSPISASDDTSGGPKSASNANGGAPEMSKPVVVSEKSSPWRGLTLLILANLIVFGYIFGIWAVWQLTPSVGSPWKLLVGAACCIVAFGTAAVLVLAADRRTARTLPGLPLRTFDGGVPRVAAGLLLAGSALSAIMLYVLALEHSWGASTRRFSVIGAVIIWVIAALLLLIITGGMFGSATVILRPLVVSPALASIGMAFTYPLLFRLLWTVSGKAIGPSWAVVLWVICGLMILVLVLRSILRSTGSNAVDRESNRPEHERYEEGMGPPTGGAASLPKEQPWMGMSTPISAAIPVSQWRRQRQALEVAVSQAMDRWRVAVMENAILPYLRLWVNSVLESRFDRKFSIFDATGLHQARARRHLVTTDALQRFGDVMSRLDGGAVALVGPRGAGKTTILEALGHGEWLADEGRRLLLVENAPLEYQPREFALHLYARLCQEVLAFAGPAPEAAGEHLLPRIKRYRVVLALLVLLAGAIIFVSLVRASGPAVDTSTLVNWLSLIATLSAVTVGLVLIIARPGRPPLFVDRVEPRPVSVSSLCAQAERRLWQIRFLQRHTVGWSGTLSAGGTQAGRTHSVELAEQTMTHPEVVHAFRDFLERTVEVLGRQYGIRPAPVVIAIDELDRLPPEKSPSFISEIKALLSPPLPGCLYLMAISDQALSDTYDESTQETLHSAFDAIVRVGHLPLVDALELLRSRAIGLPDPFLWLCHCLSGGLPRELIRIAQAVIEIGRAESTVTSSNEDDLTRISRRIVGEELARNTNIVHETIGLTSESLQASLVGLLDSAYQRPPRSKDLLQIIADIAYTKEAERSLRDPERPGLALSALGKLYQYATVLQLFDDCTSSSQPEDLLKNAYENPQLLKRLDIIATSKPLVSLVPHLGWMMISTFRKEWGLEVYGWPDNNSAAAK